MIDFIEKLLSRPKWQLVSGWIGTIVVISLIFWQFSMSSKYEQLDKSSEELSKLENQITVETLKLRNLPKLRRELELYTDLHSKALEMLPRKGQVEGLLDAVSQLAQNSGLDVKTFIPRAEIKRQFYAEIPIDMQMTGKFHEVAIFLDELSREQRIVNVQDIILDNPRGYTDNIGVDINVKVVLKTFRYLEPSERPQQNKDGKNKGSKKAS